MGNTSSHPTQVHAGLHPNPQRPLNKKRSTAFTALTLGCAAPPSIPSYYSPSQTSASVQHIEEKRSFDPPPLYAFSTPDLLEDEAASAYKTFLKQYPEYQLTWILDALRRSDFARLDRHGETYVDYMGGSLYPESLIRVHTGFLHRNILGNTHSVNNTCGQFLSCIYASFLMTVAYSVLNCLHNVQTKHAKPSSLFSVPPLDTQSSSPPTQQALSSLLANPSHLHKIAIMSSVPTLIIVCTGSDNLQPTRVRKFRT